MTDEIRSLRSCFVLGCRGDPAPGCGGMCYSCHHMLAHGRIGTGTTFVHHMRDTMQLLVNDKNAAEAMLKQVEPEE